ncbi:MAG: hypothetical protein KF782_02460 [Labilithrix sp.]|nr:hypothetical protein [Labilithrix sp.]
MRTAPLLVPLVLLLAACAEPAGDAVDDASPPLGTNASRIDEDRLRRTEEILGRGGRLAEGSLYSCLLHEVWQGISVALAMDHCETQLVEDDKKGFGDGIPGMPEGSSFDPAQITSACSAGDPTLGQSSGYGTIPGWGDYTWGGAPGQYYGLDRAEAQRLKELAVQEARELNERFWALYEVAEAAAQRLREAKASGDEAAIKAAEAAYKAANEAAKDAAGKAIHAKEKAQADPNKKPPSVGRPTQGDSPCAQTLAAAREFLRECNRNGWKTYECQKLHAQMNGCPDPALILVDPDQGYACGAKPDPEAVRAAAVKRCEQRVKYGPGGGNPCEAPSISESGLFLRGPLGDICNDPEAYVDPGQATCYGTFRIPDLGQPGFEEIVLLALERFGGPIFVRPPPPPPRGPGGPDPWPGPRP